MDLERGVLLLHWQRTTTSAGVMEKAPKGKSKRAVAIGPALIAELRTRGQPVISTLMYFPRPSERQRR